MSFGEFSFFTGLARNASIKSCDFTNLLYIKRDDFLKVILEDRI